MSNTKQPIESSTQKKDQDEPPAQQREPPLEQNQRTLERNVADEDLPSNVTSRMAEDDSGSPQRARRRRRRRKRRRRSANKTLKSEYKDACTQVTGATSLLSSSLTEISVSETPRTPENRHDEDLSKTSRSKGQRGPTQRDRLQKDAASSQQPSRPANTGTTTGASGQRGLSGRTSVDGDPFETCPWVLMPEENFRRTPAFQNHSGPDGELSFDASEAEHPALLKGMDNLETKWHSSLRSRVLALFGLVSFILLVVLLLFLAVYYRGIKKRPLALRHFCTEDECHRATSYLTSFVNKSIDACADFYQRVCYRWTSGREGVSFVNGVVISYYESIAKEVLASNSTSTDSVGSHVFAAVFKSCSRFVRSEHTVVELVAKVKERILDSLPNSYSSWKEAMVLVVKLALEHGIVTVLSIGWENSGRRHLLHLSVPKPLRDRLGAAVDVDHYRGFVSQLLPNTTEDVLNGVLKLDEAVSRIASAGSTFQEIRSSLTVSDRLSTGLATDFWITAINVHLPQEKKLTPNDNILVSELDVLKDVFTELKATPRNVAFAYLHLLVFGEVLQYDFLRKQSNKATDLTYICLQATQKVLTQTWPYVIAIVSGHEYQVHYLRDLFDQVRAATVEEVQSSKWMDATTHIAVNNRLRESTLYTFSEADRPPEGVDYRNLSVEGGDFVTDYLTALAYDAQVVTRSTPTTSQSAFLSDLQFSGRAYFDDRDSTLIVPSPYTARPLFYSTYGEQFHNFATVGVIMAAALAESVSSTRSAVRLQSRQNLESLASATECYRNQFESAFVHSNLPDYLGNSLFVWTVSVRAAYGRLKKYCQKNLSPGEMQVYWTRIQQLFFERYCLLSCSVEGTERNVSPLQMCVIPLQSMPEFAVAYSCPDGSRMNPVPKCEPL